jgi:hypothetical protein
MCKEEVPRPEIGMDCPLPTIMEDGGDGRRERSIPSLEDMWDVAPLSTTQGELS